LKTEPERWGKPFAALLGAFDAQLELNAAAIGGKDSMSGTFLDKDVPPTLISFAIAPIKKQDVISPEFKEANNPVYLFGATDESADSLKATWEAFHNLCKEGKVKSSWAVEHGIGEAVMKMSFGNNVGFASSQDLKENWHLGMWGFIVAELTEDVEIPGVMKIGTTTEEPVIKLQDDTATIEELYKLHTATLEDVYPTKAKEDKGEIPTYSFEGKCNIAPANKTNKPKVLIPVVPGTNCEYDSARAVEKAGGEAEIFVIRNLTAEDVARSVEGFSAKVKESQMIFIPGGFSGGDEPDGSAKFITAFFRNPAVKEAVTDLLDNRDGLMCGICNGFQALIKLGLVPYGKIIDTDENCPTLTFNNISRHQSRIVHTRIASTKSPWLSLMNVGDIVNVPISHGEGKFLASPELIAELAANGQIATQYVDLDGNATANIDFNPNGSLCAIEGITSPDGRVFGKMGHSERIGDGLYKNVPGEYDIRMFEAAVQYFQNK
ncbi:MAG: phosphoribosylformylglycinamidine synthase subunit PurQ, partial [Clostridia bacterium]|nr:phosphoribosylformylglycinamidine synthase subunit PurQ [Clostridia bacterium]